MKTLKGVGDYTAAAICSFAYGLPCAVVDGNVYRVLSRYFGLDEFVDTAAGKKTFASLADELIDKNRPAEYNQAIMDFGYAVRAFIARLQRVYLFQELRCLAERNGGCSAFEEA